MQCTVRVCIHTITIIQCLSLSTTHSTFATSYQITTGYPPSAAVPELNETQNQIHKMFQNSGKCHQKKRIHFINFKTGFHSKYLQREKKRLVFVYKLSTSFIPLTNIHTTKYIQLVNNSHLKHCQQSYRERQTNFTQTNSHECWHGLDQNRNCSLQQVVRKAYPPRRRHQSDLLVGIQLGLFSQMANVL